MGTAAAGDQLCQRAAGGDDISPPSGRDQRFGDFDRTAFGAARNQARNDLQHRRRAALLTARACAILAAVTYSGKPRDAPARNAAAS